MVWPTLGQQLPGGQRNFSSQYWRISQGRLASDCLVNLGSFVILQFRRTDDELLSIGTNCYGLSTRSYDPYNSVSDSYLYPVYKARRKPGTKAVIDVNNRNARGAGIEHSQEGCEAMKARAIANAGRDSNYWLID